MTDVRSQDGAVTTNRAELHRSKPARRLYLVRVDDYLSAEGAKDFYDALRRLELRRIAVRI